MASPATYTTSDAMRHALGGDPTPGKTIMDLLNASLAGDIQKYGYGYALIKNWGVAGDTVNSSRRKKHGVVASDVKTTVQDSANSYWKAQP